jgi:Tol biopolymer transport system component
MRQGSVRLTRRRWVIVAVLGALVVLGGVTAARLAIPTVWRAVRPLVRLPEQIWGYAVGQWVMWVPPRVPEDIRVDGLNPAERATVQALARRLDARIVWSSNRSGNHELYLLDLRDGSVRRLTNHPHVDYLSRFSPDGRQILFLRSQREWVSFREHGAWDLYVMNADGTGERRLASHVSRPRWSADGAAIVFHRDARVFRYDLATTREELVVDASEAVAGSKVFHSFELSPDGRRLTYAFRRGRTGAAVMDLETRTVVPLTTIQACQTSWIDGGSSLLWVELGGHGGTRVMAGRSDGSERRVFMDLPGARSHEYFPRLSPDGKWLVWAATQAGHEHDRADYEIFLWEVGTPWEKAVRLTDFPGNDQWPDLYVRGVRTRQTPGLAASR